MSATFGCISNILFLIFDYKTAFTHLSVFRLFDTLRCLVLFLFILLTPWLSLRIFDIPCKGKKNMDCLFDILNESQYFSEARVGVFG